MTEPPDPAVGDGLAEAWRCSMKQGCLVFVEGSGTGRLLGQAARQLGLSPVLLAEDPARYAADLDCYDEVAAVPTWDRHAIAHWCRAHPKRVVGIGSSSDYFILTAAEVAGYLGLCRPAPDAVARCRNKADCRAYLSASGVPIPDWALCRTLNDVANAAERLGWPVVVKPVDGSGSVGVRLAADPVQARQAAAALLPGGPNVPSLERSPGILVESYVAGPELSVEVWNGRAVTVVRKHLGPEPFFVETGHDVPAPLSSVDTAWLCHAAERAVAALGLTWGPAHVELRMADVPKVIEVNPRLAGGNIPRLVQLATGIDLVECYVAQLAGRPARFPEPTLTRAAAIRFLTFGGPGQVVSVPDYASVDPRVVEVACGLWPGREYCPAGDITDRVGHVIVAADDPDEAAAAAEDELSRLAYGCAFAPDGTARAA
jgi:S-sulfo-L-cysteine synthase (3-phospho-L-serine-dependent)